MRAGREKGIQGGIAASACFTPTFPHPLQWYIIRTSRGYHLGSMGVAGAHRGARGRGVGGGMGRELLGQGPQLLGLVHGNLIGVLLCKGLQLGQGLGCQSTLIVQGTRGVEDVLH